MRDKYIEEQFPRYFIFGGSDGLVDVASTLIDPIATLTAEQAKVLIEDRDKVIDKLCEVWK
jgi:hypothetical protein